MTEDIPLFPKASTLLVHSGNIVNWNLLKRKPKQTPPEEIYECINATLSSFLKDSDKNALQFVTDLDCHHSKFSETVPADERGDLKVTVKLFLGSLLPPAAVTEAIERALSELGLTFIETVLLSFPVIENEDLNLEVIKPYWHVMEDLFEKEVVLSLGISDLDKSLMQQLYEWAKVKPVIDQVNLESCCVMPQDLVEYSKENDIQLLTHNDPKVILSQKQFQDVISKNTTDKDGDNWNMAWALRYSVLVKCRGIIKMKGYILNGCRDTKKRK